MNRKRLLLNIFLIGLIITTSLAQNEGGYIVIGNDTIPGIVQTSSIKKMNNLCVFKGTSENEFREYTPEDITAYGITGNKYFESVYLDSTRNFAELIIKGEISLYKWDKNFYVVKNGSVLPLVEKVSVTYSGNNSIRERSLPFKESLKSMLADCPNSTKAIDELESVSEKKLISILSSYHKCVQKSFNYPKKSIAKSIIKTTILGGISVSRLHFKADERTVDYLNDKTVTGNQPIFGLAFDISFPRISQNISFHTKALFMKSDYNLSYTSDFIDWFNPESGIFEPLYGNVGDVEISTSVLKIQPGIKTKFINESMSFLAGVSTTFILDHSSSLNSTVTDTSQEINKEAFNPKSFQFGVWMGIRYTFFTNSNVNAFVEYNAELTTGLSKDIDTGFGYSVGNRSNLINQILVVGFTF